MWSPQSQNMSQQQQWTLGMTSAISMAGPKDIDLTRTDELMETLENYNMSVSEEELNHRQVVKTCTTSLRLLFLP